MSRQRQALAFARFRWAGNAKIVVPADSELVNVIGELAGVLPLAKRRHDHEIGPVGD